MQNMRVNDQIIRNHCGLSLSEWSMSVTSCKPFFFIKSHGSEVKYE
jgi:hypothetical protein